MIKGIIFDYDGVIAESNFIKTEAMEILFEKEGKDSTSVGLFIFLNFLLSFFMVVKFVNKIVKIIFFSLKNLILFETFFNFLLKYILEFLIFLCQDFLSISTLTFIIMILLISFYNFCYERMSYNIMMIKIDN